jgi:hypothetical protein
MNRQMIGQRLAMARLVKSAKKDTRREPWDFGRVRTTSRNEPLKVSSAPYQREMQRHVKRADLPL